MPTIIRKEPQRPWKTKRPAQQGRTAPRDPRYKTAAWQRLRESVLRNQPLCEWCESKGRIREATVVDHIKRVRAGGSFWQGHSKRCAPITMQSSQAVRPTRRCDME